MAHGHGFLTELELMERAGLSTLQVLRSATAANAARLGFDEIFDAIVATASFENLQRFGGTDVMARIQYDTEHPGRLLQRTLLGYLRRAIADYPVEPHSIYEFVVAGNSIMRDLFFGLDARSIDQKR